MSNYYIDSSIGMPAKPLRSPDADRKQAGRTQQIPNSKRGPAKESSSSVSPPRATRGAAPAARGAAPSARAAERPGPGAAAAISGGAADKNALDADQHPATPAPETKEAAEAVVVVAAGMDAAAAVAAAERQETRAMAAAREREYQAFSYPHLPCYSLFYY